MCHGGKLWCRHAFSRSLNLSQGWKNLLPLFGANWDMACHSASVWFSGKNFFKNSPFSVFREWIELGLNELNQSLALSFKENEKSFKSKTFRGHELSWNMEHAYSKSFRCVYGLSDSQPWNCGKVCSIPNLDSEWCDGCLSCRVHVIPHCAYLGLNFPIITSPFVVFYYSIYPMLPVMCPT